MATDGDADKVCLTKGKGDGVTGTARHEYSRLIAAALLTLLSLLGKSG
jgi:hypothetical protein